MKSYIRELINWECLYNTYTTVSGLPSTKLAHKKKKSIKNLILMKWNLPKQRIRTGNVCSIYVLNAVFIMV